MSCLIDKALQRCEIMMLRAKSHKWGDVADKYEKASRHEKRLNWNKLRRSSRC